MSQPFPHSSVFITATDTGVGKTTITAALLMAMQRHGMSVRVMKPIETGVDPQNIHHSDTERLRQMVTPIPLRESVCLYTFPQTLAPLSAARETATTIEVDQIRSKVQDQSQKDGILLVEGAGGVLTPITPTHTIRDLILALKLPCLLIGDTSLGGVNHCLLTLEALDHAGIKTFGIVLNQPTSQGRSAITHQQHTSTKELIQEWSSVPLFGPVSYQEMLEINWRAGIEQISREPEIGRLAKYLMGKVP
ncbi:MAG: dethiobiotin synthase [Nitrospirales bacterium]